MPDFASKLIVSVFGPSGAGKSTLVRALASAYGEATATAINADSYSEDLGGRCPSEMRADFALLARHLSHPLGTVCACPDYDFHAGRRTAAESSWNRFTIRPLLFVDHMYPFPAADVFLQVLAPREIAVARVAERNPDFPEWPALLDKHWERIARPSEAGLPAHFAERLVLDGLCPVAENVGIVRAHLAKFFAGAQTDEAFIITKTPNPAHPMTRKR